MRACVIIHKIVVEARRDTYEKEMASLGLFQETRHLIQVTSPFKRQSQMILKSKSISPLPYDMWTAKIVQQEDRISSCVNHFALKRRDLIAHI